MLNSKQKINIFKTASLCRNFEQETFKYAKEKKIKIPIYLSAGQEYISSTISNLTRELKINPLIFPQHRCHSIYLSFGGDISKLINELFGSSLGCTYGMGGSASIHSTKINMFGHDGHMGTQAPIGVGACFSSKKPTIVFLGDASAEEDYVLGAIGWASTKNLPIVFIIEDNNLSILTKKKVRRNWKMHDVGRAFKIQSFDINDSPEEIYKYKNKFFKQPLLLNINTNRLFWHSGAGQDSNKTFDRYKFEMKKLGKKAENIHQINKKKIEKIWLNRFEKQLKK
jgi:TPP-dependent pyruvate/acetoin dehydrogenase alpha subunit